MENVSIRDIIIYPYIKFWWYRTMLNFCGHFENGDHYRTNSTLSNFNEISYLSRLWCPKFIPDIEKFLVVAIFKMAAKIQHCPISSKFYIWVDNDVPNWFPTLFDNKLMQITDKCSQIRLYQLYTHYIYICMYVQESNSLLCIAYVNVHLTRYDYYLQY
jgi:hypothetical protein